MAESVDERIVSAKFDSTDFEKGVDKTLKKLDELNKSLNMMESGKSVTDFAKSTSESMEKAGSALDKLSNKLTTFKGMIQQQILGGLANEISSVFLRLEHGLLNFTKQLSVGQIAPGLSKYTEILNAVRTMTAAGVDEGVAYENIKRLGMYSDQTSYSLSQMTSGMSKLVAAGMKVDQAEKAMEGLANMCASAGVNIYDAQRAFLNFSQAYSSGSMRIQDWMSFEALNMATENVMKVFMEAGYKAGTLTKTVQKDAKGIEKTVYKTVNNVNKKVKAGKEVAASGFRDSLSTMWLDKKTMEIAEAEMSYFADLGKNMSELTDEELENFAARAYQAAKEARSFTDVMGTLRDVIATGWATSFEIIFGKLEKATEFFTWLTESEMADVIYSIGEFRNEVLTAWGVDYEEGGIFKALETLADGTTRYGTGRDQLIMALQTIDDLVGSIHRSLSERLPEKIYSNILHDDLSYAQQLGKRLAESTYQFREFTQAVRDHFAVQRQATDEKGNLLFNEDGSKVMEWVLKDEYANRIAKITSGFANMFGVINKVYGILTESIQKAYLTFEPILDAVGDAFGTILSKFTEINQNGEVFGSLRNGLENLLTVVKPLVGPLASVIRFAGEIGKFFVGMAIDTAILNIEWLADGLGLLIEIFGGKSAQKVNDGVGVFERWKNAIVAFGDECKAGLAAINAFFKSLFANIRKAYKEGKDGKRKKGIIFAGILEFFETNEFVQNLKDNLKKFIEKVRDKIVDWVKSAPATLRDAAKSMWSSVVNFFFNKEAAKNPDNPDLSNADSVTDKVKALLSEWLTNLKEHAKGWGEEKMEDIREVWKNVVDYIYSKVVLDGVKIENTEDATKPLKDKVKDIFTTWYTDTKTSIEEWVKGLPDEISELWKKVVDLFLGKEETVTVEKTDEEGNTFQETQTQRVKDGFSLWLANTYDSVVEWAGNAKDTISELWKEVLDILFGSDLSKKEIRPGYKTITDMFGNVIGKDTEFDPRDLAIGLKTGMYKIGETVDDEIIDNPLLAKVEDSIRSFGNKIGQVFTQLPVYIAQGFNTKLNFMSDLLSSVTTWLAGKNEERENGEKIGHVVESVVETGTEEAAKEITKAEDAHPLLQALMNFGLNLYDTVTTVIPQFVVEAFQFIKGEGSGWLDEIKTFLNIDPEKFKDDLDAGAEKIGKDIASAIESIPGYIQTATKSVKSIFKKERTVIKDLYGNIIDEKAFSPEKLNAGIKNGLFTVEKVVEDSGWLSGVKEIGKALGDSFVELGPSIINGLNTAFTWIGTTVNKFTDDMNKRDKSQGFFEWLVGYVGGDDAQESELYETIKSFGATIKGFITEVIPGFIEAGIQEVIIGVPKIINGLFNRDKKAGKESGEAVAKSVETQTDEASKAVDEALKESRTALTRGVVNGLAGVDDDSYGGLFNFMEGFGDAAENASTNADSIVRSAEEVDAALSQVWKSQEKTVDDGLTWSERRDKKIEELKVKQEAYMKNLRYNYGLNPTNPDISQNKRIAYEQEVHNFNLITNEIARLKELEEGADLGDFEEGRTDYVEATKTIFTTITEVISTITNAISESDTLAVVAVCAAAIMVFHSLQETFSIADELEAPGYTAKWIAIGAAITGIVGILGWITYLSSQEDANLPNGRLQTTMDTLHKVGEFIKDLASAGKDIMDALAIFEGVSLGKEFISIFSKDGGGFWATLAKFGIKLGIGLYAPEKIGNSFEGFVEGLGTSFAQIGESIDSFMEFLDPALDKLAAASDKTGKAIAAVQDIKTLLQKFNELINSLSVEENVSGMYEDSEIAERIASNPWANADSPYISTMYGTENPQKRDEAITANVLAETLEKRILFVHQLTEMLKNLASAFEIMENVKDIKGQVRKLSSIFDEDTEEAFRGFIEKMVIIIYDNLNKFGNKKLDISQAAAGFQLLSGALGVFGQGISDLNTENVTALGQVLDVLKGLAEAFGTSESGQTLLEKFIFGTNNIAELGKQIKLFGGYMKSFFGSIKTAIDLDTVSVADTQKRIDFVIQVAQGMAEAVSIIGSQGGVDLLDMLGQKLPGFASNAGEFIRTVNQQLGEGIDLERVQMVATGVTAIAEVMKGVGALMSNRMAYGDTITDEIPTYINSFLKGLAQSFVGQNDFTSIMYDVGYNIGAGLESGLYAKQADVLAAAESLASAVCEKFAFTVQVASPSRVFMRYGRYIDEGLANGIQQNADMPVGKMDDMANEMIETAKDTLTGSNASEEIMDTMDDMTQELVDKAKSILDDPKSSIEMKKQALDFLENAFIPDNAEIKKLHDEGVGVVEKITPGLASISQKELDQAFTNADVRNARKSVGGWFGYIWDTLKSTPTTSEKVANGILEPMVNIATTAKKTGSIIGQVMDQAFPNLRDSLTFGLEKDEMTGGYKTILPEFSTVIGAFAKDLMVTSGKILYGQMMNSDVAEQAMAQFGEQFAPALTGILTNVHLDENGNVKLPVVSDVFNALIADTRTLGAQYAPNFTDALFDSGLLTGQVNESNYVTAMTGMISGLLSDVSFNSQDIYTRMGINMMQSILASMSNGATQNGQTFVASLFDTLQGTDPAVFQSLGNMYLNHMMQGMDPNDQKTVENLLGIANGINNYFTEDLEESEPVITPVVDMSNVYAANNWLKERGFQDGTYRFDVSGLNRTAQTANPAYSRNNEFNNPKDYSALISAVGGRIDALNGAIAGMGEGMAGMQIVLDSGALVGALSGPMDQALARNRFFSLRG